MLESERQDLQRRLDKAIRNEDYELAAHLRDQITPVKTSSFGITSSGSVIDPWKWDPDNIQSLEQYRMPDMKRMQDELIASHSKLIDKALSERMVEIEGRVPSKYEGAQNAFCVHSSDYGSTTHEYWWKGQCIMRVVWKLDLDNGSAQGPLITKVYHHG